MNHSKSYIILFDGVCNLCNRTVLFVIKRDKKAIFTFASLQSESGQTLLKNLGLPTNHFNSLVFIHHDKYFIKSSAVLHIVNELGGLWKLFFVFKIFPRPIRDFIYNIIAKSRYRVFGKRDVCMLPSQEIRQRFF